MNIQIGADVEIGAICMDGTLKSVVGLIPGSKTEPHPLGDGMVQVDNVFTEFNVKPADTPENGVKNFNRIQNNVHNLLSKHSLKPVYEGSLYYPKDELLSPEAQLIGCGSDINAWTGEANIYPEVFESNLRTTGGHVHFSWYMDNIDWNDPDEMRFSLEKQVFSVIKQLDLYLGLPSLFIDKDSVRRSLYGKAGACRFKRYSTNYAGGEYRTLSNFWTDPKYLNKLVHWVYETALYVVNNVNSLPEVHTDVESVINTHDLNKAKELLKYYDLQLPI